MSTDAELKALGLRLLAEMSAWEAARREAAQETCPPLLLAATCSLTEEQRSRGRSWSAHRRCCYGPIVYQEMDFGHEGASAKVRLNPLLPDLHQRIAELRRIQKNPFQGRGAVRFAPRRDPVRRVRVNGRLRVHLDDCIPGVNWLLVHCLTHGIVDVDEMDGARYVLPGW